MTFLKHLFNPAVSSLADSIANRRHQQTLAYDCQNNNAKGMMEAAFDSFSNETEACVALYNMLSSKQTSEQNFDTSRDLRDYATRQRGNTL